MDGAPLIKPGKDKVAFVRRIVPGKLVYVETRPEHVYALKLNQVVIRERDGFCRPYRGEPLSDLGLDAGRKVVVWGLDSPSDSAPPTLVVDKNISATFSSTFSHLADKAAEIFKR